MEFSGMKLHKNCFRCFHCASSLRYVIDIRFDINSIIFDNNNINHIFNRLENYTRSAGKLYCIPHFKQLFMAKGNYDEGFGLEQHKDKWMNKLNGKTNNKINYNSNTSEDDDEDNFIDEDDDHNEIYHENAQNCAQEVIH